MTSTAVDVQGKRVPVRRTSVHRLRTIGFHMNGRKYQAIEQNPEKPSRWGKLAREVDHRFGRVLWVEAAALSDCTDRDWSWNVLKPMFEKESVSAFHRGWCWLRQMSRSHSRR